MNKTHQIRFEHISNLHLLDLKAQKKNTNYKRFFNLPLSFEESLASQIHALPPSKLQVEFERSDELFRMKKQHRIPMKKLEQLSHPKRYEESMSKSASTGQLVSIISKCDKLKKKLLTHKKLTRFQRDAGKCYDYLFELSSFNFQKYESD